MHRVFFLVFSFCTLSSLAFAVSYDNLTPGASTKKDADLTLGMPVKEVIAGESYDYNPSRHELKRIHITFNQTDNVIETISLYFLEPYAHDQLKKWFGLNGNPENTIDSLGNYIDYYLDQGISLYHKGSNKNDPVIILSCFDTKQLKKIAESENLLVKKAQPKRKTIQNKGPDPDYQAGYDIGKVLGRLLLEVVSSEITSSGNHSMNNQSRKHSDPIAVFNDLEVPQKNHVLFFDDFNTENSSRGILNYSGYKNWDVIDGSTDLIGNGFWDSSPQNGLHVDLDGTSMKGGTLVSKSAFDLLTGRYRLQFDLSGNPFSTTGPNIVEAGMQGVKTVQFSTTKKDSFRTVFIDMEIRHPTQSKVIFRDQGRDNQGSFIDNVKLILLLGDD